MTGPAAVAETHISVVFFVGDRAYKLKKAVDFPFVDLRDREARERICHREVELNRRLAPDVYLGVLDVTDPDGAVRDHLVEMRRMPPDRRLSTLAGDGDDVSGCLREVARRVAAFHAEAETSTEISTAGEPQEVGAHWDDNVTEMRPFTPETLDPEALGQLEALAHRYLEGRGPLFTRRIEAERIRDGHGDLLADDIFCLPDGPRILDCIEFNDRFRYGDVLADVAFLAMDLERLGRPDLARAFLDDYRDFAGEDAPRSLLDHYVAYRAQVRSKVACLRAEQGDPDAPEEARRLLRMATEHLERARVRLVLVGGLPGTGKTTLAQGIARQRDWMLLRSDEVRSETGAAAYGEGPYTPEKVDAAYRELLDRARTLLGLGETVVCDASWTHARHRAWAAEAAKETVAELVPLRCDAPEDVAVERITARTGDASDATPEVARKMASDADPWRDAEGIDTTATVDDSLAAALSLVGP